MRAYSQPLAILYGYRGNRNELNFIGRKGVITLTGKSRVITKILRLCNGLNSLNEITALLPTVAPATIVELASLLEKHGIVRDSREILIGFHEDSANPSDFSYDLSLDELEQLTTADRVRYRKNTGDPIALADPAKSNLLGILRERRSVRQFVGAQIPKEQLSGLLEATYSRGETGHWSVASGGALYPLDVYLIVPNDQQVVPRGVYRWDPEKHQLSPLPDTDPETWVVKTFNAKTILENAACILCIAANLERSASKYANLGYRLTVLEAGHAVQNASLFCTEQNLGSVECCSFSDKALAKNLGLRYPREAVITTLIVGIADDSDQLPLVTDQKTAATAALLRQTLVGDDKPITNLSTWEPVVRGYTMPKWAAMCTYKAPKHRTYSSPISRKLGFATGATLSEATIKVLAEGFERYALDQPRADRKEKASELEAPYLDPRVVVPYSAQQINFLKCVEPFDPGREIEWVAGERMKTRELVWVPKALVYYAAKQKKGGYAPFYRASSNGVAAHFEKQIAIESALYELIERDAFSVTWYAGRSVFSIPHGLLPRGLQSRIKSWQRLGYTVSLIDLTLDGPPVVLVIIWSRSKTPALCSGASCRPMFLDAVDRAFDEAEFMAMSWHRKKSRHGMRMEDVRIPEDHGLFYIDPRNIDHAAWLLDAPPSTKVGSDFNGGLDKYDPVVVDITPTDHTCGLSVVRVLSETLMPISFGYGEEYRGHSRMKALGYRWSMEFPSTPHFFA